MVKVTKWAEVKRARLSPEAIARIEREAREELAGVTLAQLREAAGKTQVEVAAETEMAQSELSRFERRDDRKLSTLRRYVEALGGELEVVAVVNGKRVLLSV